jgi:hypothetical protein
MISRYGLITLAVVAHGVAACAADPVSISNAKTRPWTLVEHDRTHALATLVLNADGSFDRKTWPLPDPREREAIAARCGGDAKGAAAQWGAYREALRMRLVIPPSGTVTIQTVDKVDSAMARFHVVDHQGMEASDPDYCTDGEPSGTLCYSVLPALPAEPAPDARGWWFWGSFAVAAVTETNPKDSRHIWFAVESLEGKTGKPFHAPGGAEAERK